MSRRRELTIAGGHLLPDVPAAPKPPKTAADRALEAEITAGLERLAREVRQRNLDNAVALACEAAAGRGPLVEHFAALGRDWAATLPSRNVRTTSSESSRRSGS